MNNLRLNPKIWKSNRTLIPSVERKIEEIISFFITTLKENNIDIIIDDIYIVGSNANFNYTDKSDLDLHIIVDSESYDCNKNHLPIIYNLTRKLFNETYSISIHDIPVELYIEDRYNLSNISTGIYSLNKGWIKEPTKNTFYLNKSKDIKVEVQFWVDRYQKVIEKRSIEEIEKYIDDLYSLRERSLSEEGEFGKGNLIFKELRNKDILLKLKNLRDELTSKKLSLD